MPKINFELMSEEDVKFATFLMIKGFKHHNAGIWYRPCWWNITGSFTSCAFQVYRNKNGPILYSDRLDILEAYEIASYWENLYKQEVELKGTKIFGFWPY